MVGARTVCFLGRLQPQVVPMPLRHDLKRDALLQRNVVLLQRPVLVG